jgi:hypothetical protein
MTNNNVQNSASGTLAKRAGTLAGQACPAFHKPIYDAVDGVGTWPITSASLASASLASGKVYLGCAGQMGD